MCIRDSYWNADDNTFVHMSNEGTDSEVLLSGCDYFNVSGNRVYYMRYGGNYDFYRLSLDSGEEVRLSSFTAGSFDENGNIIEDINSVSEGDNVFHEGATSTYVIEGHAFVLGTLRQSKGSEDKGMALDHVCGRCAFMEDIVALGNRIDVLNDIAVLVKGSGRE